jgi:iron complex transport system substrate-binding protein
MRKVLFIYTILMVAACKVENLNETTFHQKGNQIKYAKGFSMVDSAGFTYVEVYNPWNNYSILEKYIFSDSIIGLNKINKNIFIQTPVNKAVYLSSTYLGMVAMTNSRSTVAACSNANWIYDSILYRMYIDGLITDLGNDMTVSAEAIISKEPDAVMKYIYKGEDPVDKVIRGAGIPIVYSIEFMEQHPLGRAEWIKLVGLMTGKRHLADSMFTRIEKKYLAQKTLADSVKIRTTVLHGSSFKGTWFAAGGKSFMSQLLKDAAAEYYWYSDSSAGSIPLSFESIIMKQKNADVWLDANANSKAEILNIEPRCEIFKSFQNGNVYHYNKRINPNGGLDYYESGIVRPDLLLKDLLLILHPSLFEEEETTYWKKLE